MKASTFIAEKLRFKGRIAVISIAISFLIMIVAVSVTSGFRTQLRSGVSEIFGDVQLSADGTNYLSDDSRLLTDMPYMEEIQKLDFVGRIVPAIYKAGIIKQGDLLQGVMFKGIPDGPDCLGCRLPSAIAAKLSLKEGDRITVYFAGEKVRVRKFTVKEVYDAILG